EREGTTVAAVHAVTSDVDECTRVLPLLERGPRPPSLLRPPLGACRTRVVRHRDRFDQIVGIVASARIRRRTLATVMRMRATPLPRGLVALPLALLIAGGIAATALGGSTASAESKRATKTGGELPGVQHLHFAYGPLDIRPGQNVIQTAYLAIPQPKENGF